MESLKHEYLLARLRHQMASLEALLAQLNEARPDEERLTVQRRLIESKLRELRQTLLAGSHPLQA